ncbi:MAG: hypothetical protein C9356_07550 [Oleiphilus sp.]|nr:MAG: hypothetical protein C9356_07550 [Oleiphilus sp.]
MTSKPGFGVRISTKLLAGIAALIFLSVVSALVAWGTLDSTRKAQTKLTEKTFPVLRLAQSLSYEIVSYLQVLEQRYALEASIVPMTKAQKLEDREHDIKALLRELRERILGQDSLVQVEDSLNRIFRKKAFLESLSNQDRPELLATLFYGRQLSSDALEGLRRELDRHRITAAGGSLALQNTYSVLKEAVSELVYFVAISSEVLEPQSTQSILVEFKQALRQLVRHSQDLPDPELKAYIASKADLLLMQTSSPEGLFASLKALQKLNDRTAQAIHYTKVRGYELERHLDAMVVRASEQASSDIAAFDQKTSTSLGYLVNTLVALVVGSLLLVFVYLLPQVTRRLERLSESTRDLADGDFDVAFDTRGGDELGVMAQALEMFRVSLSEKQKTADLLGAMLEASDNGILISDSEGVSALSNRCFQEMWALSDSVVQKGDESTISEQITGQLKFPDRFREVSAQLKENNTGTFKKILELKDGRYIERYTQPFESSGKVFRIFSDRDVTTQYQAQNSLHLAKENAEQAARAKSEFLAVMSHEIRTPMNGVLGMLNLLLDTPLTEAQKHRASLAKSSAESLLGLINDILDFSMVEAGKLEFESIDFDLQAMLGDLAQEMAVQAENKNIDLVIDLREVRPATVKADPGRIRQIFSNLINNAIKFTDEGEVLVRARLVEGRVKPLRLEGQVIDEGIGIPQEKLDSLFSEFTQVDASTTRKYGGTGLGLVIVRKLCEQMHGQVVVDSEEGRGSRFSFSLELDRGAIVPLEKVMPDLEYKNVLLVEASATRREVMSLQLADWGMKVFDAANASEAIAISEQRVKQGYQPVFDLALIDMKLPEVESRELAQWMKSERAMEGVKKILMTSISMAGKSKDWEKQGYVASFAKPATVRDMKRALNNALAKQTAQVHTLHGDGSVGSDTPITSPESIPSTLRILLVEDNQVNQLVTKGMLEQLGLRADVAGDGKEALDSLRMAPDDTPYSLVLMDCQMPVMDGYEATRAIRNGDAGARYVSIAVVAMTANAMQGDKEKCLASGMDDYIAKPVSIEQLRETLARLHAENRLMA